MSEELKQATISKKRIRSVAYPSLGLQEAIQNTEDLRKKLGMGPYSRDAAVKALGYSGISGASGTKIAALVHFGLLSRDADTYRQSPLADRILVPPDEAERDKAIIEAVKTPKLYNQLISDFTNKSLPTLLPNVLFHTYKINEKVAQEVATNFTQSIEFAGILKNGIITDAESDIVSQKSEAEELATPIKEVGKPESGKVLTAKPILGAVSIPLGQNITVSFSANLFRALGDGKFKDVLETLEKLGEGEVSGTSKTNASNTPVESD